MPSPNFTVWKFPLELDALQHVRMPLFARLLCVQLQYGRPTLWALVNTWESADEPTPYMQVPVFLVGTGHPVPENADYLSTIQLDEGRLVLHVFHQAHMAKTENA